MKKELGRPETENQMYPGFTILNQGLSLEGGS